MMTNTYKILRLESRIAILQERPKENGRVVNKLQRQLRNLKAMVAAAGPETV